MLKCAYKKGIIIKKISSGGERKIGNIFIPQSVEAVKGENPLYEVVSITDDVTKVSVGDIVIIEDLTQRSFLYEGETFARILEKNIFGIIKNKKE